MDICNIYLIISKLNNIKSVNNIKAPVICNICYERKVTW